MGRAPTCVLRRSARIPAEDFRRDHMEFAPTEQPEGPPDGPTAEQPASQPEYVAAVQPVATPARGSRPLIAGAILAGAIGLTAVAVGLASGGAPAAAAPAVANARGVLLGADTGTWTAPNGGAASAPNVTGMMGNRDGNGFGPGAGMGGGGSEPVAVTYTHLT